MVVIVATTLGCRGSRPFGRLVQVSSESNADLPEVEAPEQRLATAKPRSSAGKPDSGGVIGMLAGAKGRTENSPHVTRAPAAESDVNPNVTQAARAAADRDSAQRTAANSRTRATTSTLTQGPVKSATATNRASAMAKSSEPKPSDVQKRTAKTNKPTPDRKQQAIASSAPKPKSSPEIDSAELMEAINDLPPDVRRHALRSLVARTSQSADRTNQPNSLDSELAKNVLNLPKLPDSTSKVSDTPPKRIATEAEEQATAVASVKEDQKPSPSEDKTVASGSVTDLVTTELESTVVRAISDESDDEDGDVKPASASRGASDDSMVTRASVEPTPRKKRSIEPSDTSTSGKLSDQALYAALLKRLSAAVPGESEAERSSRMIRLRHMMVLAGDPDAAVEPIEGMSESEQEYLRHQLLGLWTMTDPQGHPVASRRFTAALPQIREAVKFAAAATDSLEVRSLAFCTEIESYGQIKTFSGNRFDAGQQVILYCEIENFSVNQVDDGFETHLQGSYDIYDQDNEKVASQVLPADKQVSANYLRDYFIAYQMHLPQQLSAGTYRLQLTMEDVNGKKYGQASIPLEIAK